MCSLIRLTPGKHRIWFADHFSLALLASNLKHVIGPVENTQLRPRGVIENNWNRIGLFDWNWIGLKFDLLSLAPSALYPGHKPAISDALKVFIMMECFSSMVILRHWSIQHTTEHLTNRRIEFPLLIQFTCLCCSDPPPPPSKDLDWVVSDWIWKWIL